ncbi:UspA domain-containing protein [Halovivax asiaticus JCM 14624]|uniref:UspA domain-containing protein n=1 Tax=Halovivax asiaticus JCM 14624 TaxID=1227490 RepID=M0BQY0_9EURY|nr:universal stress protein [Halovivax asiaticus]ELZ13416.1 UspA domain-containing protein [Halovivax asiaticus JCM 14624]
MTLIVAPVRYPLDHRSKATLTRAIQLMEDRDADLTVLHVNLYQNGHRVTRRDLKEAVEREFGRVTNGRFVVRTGFLVEESILDEVAAENADVVVVGREQSSLWRRLLRRLTSNPNIDEYLRSNLDCEIVTAEATPS